MKRIVRKTIAAACVMAAFSGPAAAQWAVIDASNLYQNIVNTISTFTQEYQQVQQYVTQLQQLQYEYMQLKGLAEGEISPMLGTVGEALGAFRMYENGLKNFWGDLNSAKSVVDNMYNRMSASGLSDADWMAREADRNRSLKDGTGFLSAYEANVLNQVGKRYEQVQQMQEKVVATTGTHEAMQLMNGQMNALLGTTNQLLENNALMAQRQLNRDAEEIGRKQAAVDGNAAYLDAVAASRKKTTAELEKIK